MTSSFGNFAEETREMYGCKSFTCAAKSDPTIQLRVARWQPTSSNGNSPAGVLILVHGLSEHSGRWAQRAQWFSNELEFDVWSYDHRGHGLSTGARTHMTEPTQLLDDLIGVVNLVHAQYEGKDLPFFMFGHSLGGLIVTAFMEYVVDRNTWPHINIPVPNIKAYVLSAPALVTDQVWILQKLAPLAAAIAPNMRLSSAIKGSQLAADPAVGTTYFADPLVTNTLAITSSFGKNVLTFMALTRSEANLAALEKSKVPVMIYHGEHDTLVPIRASEMFVKNVPHAKFVPLPETRHEAHFEKVANQIMKEVVDFYKSVMGSEAAAATLSTSTATKTKNVKTKAEGKEEEELESAEE